LTAPEGIFFSAEDADSEGVEGKFYVWTPAEISAVLGKADGERVCQLFEVTSDGSFEHGTSVLRLATWKTELPPDDQAFIDRVRPALYAAREGRVRPGRDDKANTSWNGLMISALARAGAAFDEIELVK
jgi:hypothetical protein